MDPSVCRAFAALGIFLAACGGGQGGEAPARTAAEPVGARPAELRGGAAAPASAPASASKPPAILDEPAPESAGSVSLEPLVVGVRPGGTFLLSARFKIAPGYRIGWKIPGQVGKATQVTFRAPPGFEVGPVLFPAPDRYTVPGGFVGYGYEKETAVFVEVKAPAHLGRSDVHRFDMEAAFVACKKQCASERTAAFVELSTAYGDVRAAEVETSLAPFHSRLPKAASELGVEASWEHDGRHATLVVTVPTATPRDFFPAGDASPAPVKTALGEHDVRFVFDEAPRPGSRLLRGVLVAEVDGLVTAIDVEAPLPGQEGEGAEAKARAEQEKAAKGKSGRPRR